MATLEEARAPASRRDEAGAKVPDQSTMTSDRFSFACTASFSSRGEADMVRNALDVDAEKPKMQRNVLQLRPQQVSRRLRVDGSQLVAEFKASDARTLRAAVGTFCDLLGLAIRTLEAFRP